MNWQIVLIAAGYCLTPQRCEESPAHLWTSEGRPKSKSTVLGDLPCKMVLGEDALQDGQGIINFGLNMLRWHRREWPKRRIEHAFEASLGQVLPETGYEQINQLIQKNADLFSAKGEPNVFCSNSPIHIKKPTTVP